LLADRAGLRSGVLSAARFDVAAEGCLGGGVRASRIARANWRVKLRDWLACMVTAFQFKYTGDDVQEPCSEQTHRNRSQYDQEQFQPESNDVRIK